jgi:alkyl sulfatase BDS1-like metallo-beta-lactamase superfamily hydrolase
MAYTETKDHIEIEEVATGYYVVKDRQNMGFIVTDEGVVVIDTLLRSDLAEQVYEGIRKITDLPIRYLIYTHGHFDHVNAARAYLEPGTIVVAQANLRRNFDIYHQMPNHFQHLLEIQFNGKFGSKLTDKQVYPNIEFMEKQVIRIGEKTLILQHMSGESNDHCSVYIPEDDIAFVGDMFTGAFPNAGSPQKANRDETAWIESLKHIQRLNPAILIPGHREVIVGKEKIVGAVQDMIDVLTFIRDEVIKQLNQGNSLSYMLDTIKLPEYLENSPNIEQCYGCLEFAIKGIHRNYTGWFNGNPTDLRPEESTAVYKEIISVVDGKALLQRAKELYDSGNAQMCMHLLDLLLQDDELRQEAMCLRKDALHLRAEQTPNRVMKSMYEYYEDKTEKNCAE